MRRRIYLLGTIHTTNSSKRAVEDVMDKYAPQAFFREGAYGQYSKRDCWVEPFFVIALKLYIIFLKKRGSEFDIGEDLAKKNMLPIYYIDLSISELIQYFHRWYNPIIFLLGLLYCYLYVYLPISIIPSIITPVPLKIMGAIILTFLIYFGYFVWRTKGIRDHSFIKKTEEFIEKNDYSSILLICGKLHCEQVEKNLSNKYEIIRL